MPVEVERDQGEVSVKVELENKHEMVNGISHGNGNEKEDSDGSYVFITENDSVGDDSVGSDSPKPVDANVEKDLKEEENTSSGELKTEVRSTSADDSQPLENSEPEKVAGITKSEIQDPLDKSVVEQHPGNVLPDSEPVEVVVSELSHDISAEVQTLVVENGSRKSESEEIQNVKSEIGLVDVPLSDEGMNTHPESQDDSELAPGQDGKQHVASEVTEVLDARASEERSDDVIVAKESVSEAASSDGLSCTNQQESELYETSRLVEKFPSHKLHEDVSSGNDSDTSVNPSDETRSQGCSEDHGADKTQNIQDDSNAQSEEVTNVNEKHASVEKVQENNKEGNLKIGGESAEEAKESPTGDLSGNVSNESAETVFTNVNRPSNLLDVVSELTESSALGAADETGAAATKSEAVQLVKEISEPHVVAPAIEDSETSREANCGSEVTVTQTTHVDVCEDTPPEEVSEMHESVIKESYAINTDEKVDSNASSTKPLLVNNDIVKVSDEEDSSMEKKEASGTTASVASDTKTCAHDLESKVVTSTDTIHTGAKDCVDSQPAENKEGKLIKNEIRLCTFPIGDEKDEVDSISKLWCSRDAADKTDGKVASTSEIGVIQPASTTESSALDASDGPTVAAEIEKRPFYFLPRVPRYYDEKLAEQLKHAEDQVDQKTQSRDALRADIQKIRATCKDYDISYKAALAEERSARKAMYSKRQEIEVLQSVISRVKSVASVNDIDLKMQNMEHMIQHETLTLSEEKGLIREIKQLKQLRKQISLSMGTTDKVKQALDEKEKTEESLKVLKKELDELRSDLSKAEAITKAAKKKCDEEREVQSKLQEKYRAADVVRQEAFAHLQDLKKQQREKNKYFFKYRDDSREASEMALNKDRAALQSLCSDQVENFMDKWNNDDEFRSYYVRCNTRSTSRRLGTLDGRSLGPDEEPPRITYAPRTDRLRSSSDKAEKHETVPPVSSQEEKVVKYEGGSKVENKGKAVAKPAEQKSQATKSKKTVQPDMLPPIVKELVSKKEEVEKPETKVEEEPPTLSKEEEELIKKEEEKRKRKEAAKLKEQHRLEEIAKAKEAMERKKKSEEKAEARAVRKAQKVAEEREKEREKKLRKKERRKGVSTSVETTKDPIETSETVIETPREIEILKKQSAEESQQMKKSHKPASQFLKQNKSKSIPLPLRNRASKRKLKQYMWIGLIALVVLALFLLGNANLSFSPANLWFI